MRAQAASLRGVPLNAAELALLQLHREQLGGDEAAALEAQEQRLLQLAAAAAGAAAGAGGAGMSRGDMAAYVGALEDILNRRFLVVTDLLRTCEDYRAKFGREVGLLDPGAPPAQPAGAGAAAGEAAGAEQLDDELDEEGELGDEAVLDDDADDDGDGTAPSAAGLVFRRAR
jgi:hypothetical protein